MSKDRVVVVTGAADGIGLGIATRFAEDGHPTLMIDVQGSKLEEAVARLAASGHSFPQLVDESGLFAACLLSTELLEFSQRPSGT